MYYDIYLQTFSKTNIVPESSNLAFWKYSGSNLEVVLDK